MMAVQFLWSGIRIQMNKLGDKEDRYQDRFIYKNERRKDNFPCHI